MTSSETTSWRGVPLTADAYTAIKHLETAKLLPPLFARALHWLLASKYDKPITLSEIQELLTAYALIKPSDVLIDLSISLERELTKATHAQVEAPSENAGA
jgi:hypothetical protein